MELSLYIKTKIHQLQNSMNKKGSQSTAHKFPISKELQLPKSQTPSFLPELTLPEIKKFFVERLRKLPTEQRYLAVKIHSLDLILSLRKAFRRLDCDKNTEQNNHKIQGTDTRKFPHKTTKNFFDGLVLMSDEDYLDSVGFDFNLIESPEKLFDLLTTFCNEVQTTTTLKDLTVYREPLEQLIFQMGKVNSREELAVLMCKILRQEVIPQILDYHGHQRLDDQKTRKKQFTLAWKNCSEQGRYRMLYLGKSDSKQTIHYLLDQKRLMPLPEQIEKEIFQLLKSDKNELCNKVFKSRLKKSYTLLEDYHEQVYKAWREEVDKKKKKKAHQRHRKRRNEKNRRKKSLSVSSNQTNETENREETGLDVQELLRLKLGRDIIEFSDQISIQANQLFDRRVQAFSRLQYLLQKYFSSNLHVFGSCACGLAVKNSDIDVAIDEKFLDNFQYVPSNKRVGVSLQYLAQNLESKPWIKKLKLINTASIPIINLTIDTSVPMHESYMSQDENSRLNSSSSKGEVDVDLTVQTVKQEYGPNHLGIISTLKLRQWLEDYEKLQEITIILKHYLSVKSLSNTYSGGLKTYSLVVMIIAYLKDRRLENSGAIQSIMHGLTRFYGFQFNENKYGIDISSSQSVFYQKSSSPTNSSAALEIKDPINGKIMTKSCYSFHQIKKLMRDIYEKCFENTQFQLESFCFGLNPKVRKLATHQILLQFNEAYPKNNFDKVIAS